MRLWRRSKHDTGGKTLGYNMHLGCLCLSLGAEKELRVDKAPRPSISNVIWILSSDTICQLNQLFSNSEAAMLSRLLTLPVLLEVF